MNRVPFDEARKAEISRRLVAGDRVVDICKTLHMSPRDVASVRRSLAPPPPLIDPKRIERLRVAAAQVNNSKKTSKQLLDIPPNHGMRCARLAIMRLEEIRVNDTERQQAFTAVKEWIDGQQ